MKIVFLGTGDAFDEKNPNNSSLVISEETNLLLDCGLTTPYQLWRYNNDQNLLDAVYISHLHADHYFGLPSLLMRMWSDGRTKPLTIVCQKDFKEVFEKVMEYAYEDFASKFKFKINFLEIDSSQEINFQDLELSFAETKHGPKNLAIKIESKGKSICNSGDGDFTEETEELYKGSDLVIQETFLYDEKKLGHGSVVSVVKMAEENNIKRLALVHINRYVRQEIINKNLSSDKVEIIIPEPFDEYEV